MFFQFNKPFRLKMSRIYSIALCSLCLQLGLVAVARADDAEQVRHLLSEMSEAIRTLDYTGLFTFEVGGSLDTYRIDHRVAAGQEIETLQRLNGELRSVTREGDSGDCLSSGKRLLQDLITDVQKQKDLLANYHYEIHPQQRIAQRNATVVNLIPISNDRYGYSIGIDETTYLPLKIVLIAPNKMYLERIQFIELNRTEQADAALETVAALQNVDSVERPSCNNEAEPQLHGWYVAWLPNGFVFSGQRRVATGDEMLSFTDGLASFSVFIGDSAEKPPVREAKAQLGATSVYMVRGKWQQTSSSVTVVTVVGEVPLPTAQKVAESISPQ